jgi:hypothetical protein
VIFITNGKKTTYFELDGGRQFGGNQFSRETLEKVLPVIAEDIRKNYRSVIEEQRS